MNYFLVTKRIGKKKKPYYYFQRTWKENGKTKTHSVYVGPATTPPPLVPPAIPGQAHTASSFDKLTETEQNIVDGIFGISEATTATDAETDSDASDEGEK